MSLDNFKNIDEVINEGTSLTSELNPIDLALIDKGFKATPFNIGINDTLEFILYDSSNNILEQKDYGNVRYIMGEEINEYLIRSENLVDKLVDGGGFLIDIKRLIKEAGYNIGIFRVQLNFVNDRVGSSIPKDKLWIQEISPTRLELRLLPFDNFEQNNPIDIDTKIDLNQAYNSFVLNKFSGDEVYSEIDEILNRLTPSDLYNTFKKIKKDSYINQLGSEFGINSFEIFFSKVLESMKVSVRYALLHKNSTIASNDFGKPLGDIVDFIYYNKKDIIRLLNNKFEEAVEYHLPNRSLSDQVRLDNLTKNSIDKLQDLVQSIKSDKTQQYGKVATTIYQPKTADEVRELFKTEKKIIPNPVEPDKPSIIEVPILIDTDSPPPTPIVIEEPETSDDAIERNRLRRLQEEMMYQDGGMGTRFDVPYQSPYETPQPTGNGVGGGGGYSNEYLSNEDYIRTYERRNIENAQ